MKKHSPHLPSYRIGEAVRYPEPPEVAEELRREFSLVNAGLPLVPQKLDLAITIRTLRGVSEGKWAMSRYLTSRFSERQLSDIATSATGAHLDPTRNLPFIVEGTESMIKADSLPLLRRNTQRILAERWVPIRVPAVMEYDASKGYFIIWKRSFINGWDGLKHRLMDITIPFMRDTGILTPHPRNTEKPVGTFNQRNGQRIEAFMRNPDLSGIRDQFLFLLEEAQNATHPRAVRPQVVGHTRRYSMNHVEGRPGFRMTPELMDNLRIVRDTILTGWMHLPERGRISAAARDNLIRNLTYNKALEQEGMKTLV